MRGVTAGMVSQLVGRVCRHLRAVPIGCAGACLVPPCGPEEQTRVWCPTCDAQWCDLPGPDATKGRPPSSEGAGPARPVDA